MAERAGACQDQAHLPALLCRRDYGDTPPLKGAFVGPGQAERSGSLTLTPAGR